MGKLYLVPTPIGNLEDITLRALRILKTVSLIAAEDTRTTGRLLKHFEIETPLTSYHEHNERQKVADILDALAGGDVALVSDAGTPGISDPGYVLIQAALAHGVEVIPLPGANAILPALVASGLPTDSFLYLGFLPRKTAIRRKTLEAVRDHPYTLIFYETPHRLPAALEDVRAVLGERTIAVARELTKLYEEIWRGTVSEALEYYTAHPPKGEITLIIEGAHEEAERWPEAAVREALAQRLERGEGRSAAARELARESGWARRELYNLDL